MDEKEATRKIIRFAKPIIPRNWKIFAWGMKKKGPTLKPGDLCLMLSLCNAETDFDEEEDGSLGSVEGPMRFLPLNFAIGKIKEMQFDDPHSITGGYISSIDLKICFNSLASVEEIIIHELAHIAVLRFFAQKCGHKPMVFNQEKKMHGPLFQKAFKRMILRSEKAWGKKHPAVIGAKNELKYWKRGQA